MADAQQKVRRDLRRAQASVEGKQTDLDAALAARRESFERARAAGLSMRDIAKETGLNFTRVAQILQKK
jgi:hypothetical protein